ncbi:MAG: beta-propeller domain-containing protein, partial [Methanoregula sp.]|nr:beta-propeller domain-containing protein [Methanoregula sp.]
MNSKNVPLLILSGLIMGLILAYVVMAAFPPHTAGTSSTVPPIQPVMQQKITAGAEEPRQFSSKEEARAFLTSHTKEGAAPVLLNPGAGPATTRVAAVANGTRIWQFEVDTSTYKPDEYIVTVEAILQRATGTALFNLLDSPEGKLSAQEPVQPTVPATQGHFITIDPIGDRYVGEKFTITGRTNLAPDDEMLVQVYSSSFKPTQKSQSGEFSGSTGTVRASRYSESIPVADSASQEKGERKYSATNVQVQNVEEADIVKTDGTYAYVITGNRLHILYAYPADKAGFISTLQFSGSPQSLYLDGDRLVLISADSRQQAFMNCRPGVCGATLPAIQKTRVFVYSVKDPIHPALLREIELDGTYKDTRMIGSMLYFVTGNALSMYDNDVTFPGIYDSGRGTSVPSVWHFSNKDQKFSLTTVGAVDIRADDPVKAKTFLVGSAGTVYVSPERLYIAIPEDGDNRIAQVTRLYSFTLDNGQLTYTAQGIVNGTLLNQFSLDEYGGNLRVATTVDSWSTHRNRQSSEVAVLDNKLNVIGTVSNLAPDESIYAARFMGERLYLVTFRETDPLFVIDLAVPTSPKVLGELQIPGFSRYLHPYDSTHLIGIGKQSTRGGLKIALFNVTDVHNPQLVGEKKLGGYGSDSEVLRDHKAFLFDREKDLLVLPVHIVEDSTSSEGIHPVWGGAYVFGVNPQKGFTEKGTVVHYRDGSSASCDV